MYYKRWRVFFILSTSISSHWKTIYMCLLWLAMLLMTPFNLSTILSTEEEIHMDQSIYTIAMNYLSCSGPLQKGASLCLYRLLVRYLVLVLLMVIDRMWILHYLINIWRPSFLLLTNMKTILSLILIFLSISYQVYCYPSSTCWRMERERSWRFYFV